MSWYGKCVFRIFAVDLSREKNGNLAITFYKAFHDTIHPIRVFRALDKLGTKSIYGRDVFTGKWKIPKTRPKPVKEFDSIDIMNFEVVEANIFLLNSWYI